MRRGRRYTLTMAFILLVVYYGGSYWYEEYSCSDWDTGINGLHDYDSVKTKNNETLHYCRLKKPKGCKDKLISGIFDLSYFFYDCTKTPFVDKDRA
jgi:hypothetical protein